MSMNYKITFLFILVCPCIVFAQERRWYPDKPNTKADTIAILINKVRSFSEWDSFPEDTVQRNGGFYKVFFYTAVSSIDSVKYVPYFFPGGTIKRKQKKKKIIERVELKLGADDKDVTVYRRKHYLDKNGQIIKTRNKRKRGAECEGESYSMITYEYKNGLLIREYIYDGAIAAGYYYIKEYRYEYYP